MLLIDEVDRADDEFEAFLLEILADYAVTVPELGTFRADDAAVVVITSNRTRDVHDALKRRCLYHWVEHPDFEREVAIVRLRAPERERAAGSQRRGRGRGRCATSASTSRRAWPRRSTGPRRSLCSGGDELDEASFGATLGTVVKYREDQERRAPRGHRRSRGGGSPWRLRRWRSRSCVCCGRAGLDVPLGSTLVYVDALGRGRLTSRPQLYWAGRATLVRRPEDVAVYDRVVRPLLAGRHDGGSAPRSRHQRSNWRSTTRCRAGDGAA